MIYRHLGAVNDASTAQGKPILVVEEEAVEHDQVEVDKRREVGNDDAVVVDDDADNDDDT